MRRRRRADLAPAYSPRPGRGLGARAACWLLALWLTHPHRVLADSTVVVLGVHSDGEDALARRVSQALRDAAKRIRGYRVSFRDISLSQMSLVHECEELDARCMADIASTLKVDRVIYGSLDRRRQAHQLTLYNFDALSGQVDKTVRKTYPAGVLAGGSLGSEAVAIVGELSQREASGSLRVRSRAVGARVRLDGHQVGVIDEAGEFSMQRVKVGDHALVVRQEGARSADRVSIREGQTTTVDVALTASPEEMHALQARLADEEASDDRRESLRRGLGYGAIGLAGLMVGGTVYAWARIGRINRGGDLHEYRRQFGPDVNACSAARAGKLNASMAELEGSARDLCDEVDTLEVLQYVFLGTALVAGGVGTYLLMTARKGSDATQLSLHPTFSRGEGGLSARLRF